MFEKGQDINSRYTLVEKIGEGGMSDVWLSQDRILNLPVALKFIKEENKSYKTEEVIRFRKEALTISKLNHPHIIKVLEIADFKGRHFVAMEFINGKNLAEEQHNHVPFTLEGIIELITQLCNALVYVHNRGILHRDLKPSNIMHTQDHTGIALYKLLDFGLVEFIAWTGKDNENSLIGTLCYMSPEQGRIIRKPVDERSDLYSLGVIFYQLLTGRLPFTGSDIGSILHQQIARVPPAPSHFDNRIPRIIDQIVMKLLRKEPDERYQTASGLLFDLNQALSGRHDYVLGSGDRQRKLPCQIRMIGRKTELNRLQKLYENAQHGEGGLCLISGEAGIGKSMLLEKFRGYVCEKNGLFLGSKCNSHSHKIPFRPFGELLDEYARWLEQLPGEAEREKVLCKIREVVGGLGELVLRLNPVIRRWLKEIPPLVTLEKEELESERFLITAGALFCSLGAGQYPTVLVFDDMQWSDESSFMLLSEIIRRLPGSGLLVLVVYRDSALPGFSADLKTKSLPMCELHLAPLDLATLNNLVSNLLFEDEDYALEISRYILEKSKGNPFFAIEIVRQLVDEGVLVPGDTQWVEDWERLKALNIPATLVDMLLNRISLLSGEEKDLLSAAAVIGKEFTLELLFGLIPLSAEEVVTIIDKALAMQLLEYAFPGKERIRFSHDRIKEAFYRILDEGRQRSLHLKIAALMESLPHEKSSLDIFNLVIHYAEGGDEQKTLAYTLPAGDLARQQYAHEEAIRYYTIGLGLLEKSGIPAGTTAEQAWLATSEKLCDLYITTGRNEKALERIQALLPRLHRNDKLILARVYLRMARAYFKNSDYDHCEKIARYGLKLAGESLPLNRINVFGNLVWQFLVHILHNLLPFIFMKNSGKQSNPRYALIIGFYSCLNWMYILTEKIKFVRSTVRMLNLAESKTGKSRELGISLTAYASLCMGIARFERAIAYHQKGLELRSELKDEWGLAQSLQLLGFCYQWKGEPRKSLSFLHESRHMFERIGDLWELGMTWNGLALSYFDLACYKRSLHYYHMYIDLNRKIGYYHGLCSAQARIGWNFIRLGAFHQAKYRIRESLELSREKNIRFIHCLALTVQGCLLLKKQAYRKAITSLENARKMYEADLYIKNYSIFLYVYLAEAYLQQFKAEAARLNKKQHAVRKRFVLDACRRAMQQTKRWVTFHGTALRITAEYHAFTGNSEMAHRFFKRSIAHCRSLKQKYQLARSYLLYGQYLAGSGAAAAAQSCLGKAHRLFKSIHAAYYEHAAAGALGIREPSSSRPREILLSQERLAAVISVSRIITTIFDSDRLLDIIMDTAIKVTGAYRGYLLIENEVKAARNIDKQTIDEPAFRFSQKIVARVSRSGKALLANNAQSDKRLGEYASIRHYALKSILCVPIKYQNTVRGVCYLDNPLASGVFTREDRKLLSVFAAQAAIALENAQSYRTILEMNRGLEARIRQRTADLEQANHELEIAYNNLKNKEAQLIHAEKTTLLGQLVAGIAYEINDPITYIHGNMQYFDEYMKSIEEVLAAFRSLNSPDQAAQDRIAALIKKTELDFVLADIRKLIGSCKEGAERLQTVVTGLCDFSRQDEAEMSRVDIRQGIATALDLLQHELKDRIAVHENLPAGLPAINCYASQLNQVFMNLLVNAVQAIPGKGDIWIDGTAANGHIRIAIRDNGLGIRAGDLGKIFDPFFTTKPAGKGTGLGLAISYGIIRKHGGDILVESTEGSGALFTVILPVADG